MHPVLCVEEILLNVFSHCFECTEDLYALATTCKAFKEPALDVLWAELNGLAPLVRCLPESSYAISYRSSICSLTRPLEQADWDIILSYTRRVRVFYLSNSGLALDCLKELSNPPSSVVSIFPKLAELTLLGPTGPEVNPFLQYFTGPRLTALRFGSRVRQDDVEVFGERCPNITTFETKILTSTPILQNPDKLSDLVCQWPKLQVLHCYPLSLRAAAIIHLSQLHNLRRFSVRLLEADVDLFRSTRSLPSTSTFPALVSMDLRSHTLVNAQMLFDHFRFPVVENLTLALDIQPTTLELTSFFAALPGACNHLSLGKIVMGARCAEMQIEAVPDTPLPYIDFHHLRPLANFVKIRNLCLILPCGVDLSEPELLWLVSSWPHLETFDVADVYERCIERTASNGITPGGFVQLLERCPSLSHFRFLFNTHGYTEIPRGHPWGGRTMSKNAVINVRTSLIEEESINALAAFFRVGPFPDFYVRNTWHLRTATDEEEQKLFRLYAQRWSKVSMLAKRFWANEQDLLNP